MSKTTTYVLVGAGILLVVVLMARSSATTVKGGAQLGTVGGALAGLGSLVKSTSSLWSGSASNSGDYVPDVAQGTDVPM